MKERLDVLRCKRGMAVSREKAKAVIMAGNVYVSTRKKIRGTMFQETVNIEASRQYLKICKSWWLKA